MAGSTLKVTILGCGTSGGVPRVGNFWGVCDPNDPRNRRRRCSILIQKMSGGASTDVIVDTAPDFREQILDAGLARLDAVLFTHDHADQTHGIDDLRGFAYAMRKRIEVYLDEPTADTLTTRFGYCFSTPAGSYYPPILNANLIPRPLAPLAIEGPGGALEVRPFEQEHGQTRSLGFRCGPVAYSSDVSGLSEESFRVLEGVECWIVDAMRYEPHPTHSHVEQTLAWIAHVKPKHAVLTNLHFELDYATLKAELPPGIEPAYDGMTLEFPVD